MTIENVTAPAPVIERDGWGRPKVIPPKGGKPVAYTRCTTYIGGIEDLYTLGQWQQRHVARGIAENKDLQGPFLDPDLWEDKAYLNEVVDEAKKRAGAGDSAAIGTYLHRVTELADRGIVEEVPLPWLATPRDPTEFLPDVAAYLTATECLKAVEIEAFSVLDGDDMKIAGTPDRIVKYEGKKYIADLKTGSVELGALKIAAQLAVYSRSALYDWEAANALGDKATHVEARALRIPTGVETDRGIVIHLPQGTGTCELYWVDLVEGWRAVILARDIRAKRRVGFRQVMTPFPKEPPPPASAPGQPVFDLAVAIVNQHSADAIRALWRDHASEWNEDLTALAKARITQLNNQ